MVFDKSLPAVEKYLNKKKPASLFRFGVGQCPNSPPSETELQHGDNKAMFFPSSCDSIDTTNDFIDTQLSSVSFWGRGAALRGVWNTYK